MADQAASALSNTVVAVLVARRTGVAQFGAFSLALVAAQLTMAGIRSLVGEPLLSLYSNETPEVRRGLLANLQATTLFLGVLTSAILWMVAAVAGGLSGSALTALAVVLPLMLFQDTWRFAFIVDRPGAALAVDVVWLVALAVALPLAPADAGASWYVVVWGITGGLGGLVGMVLGGRLPGRPHPWRWLVEHRSVSWRYFTEFATARASSELVLAVLGLIAGLGALGAAKASFVFYGLLNTLHAGVYLAVVPEGARQRDQPGRLRRTLTIVSAVLAVVAGGWMVLGLVLPDSVGRELFGATWEDASALIVPMGVAVIFGGVGSGGLLGLRALGDARRSLRARLWCTLWLAVCPLVGAFVGEAMGFAVGFAIGRVVAAMIWWGTFGQALRDRARGVRATLLQRLFAWGDPDPALRVGSVGGEALE